MILVLLIIIGFIAGICFVHPMLTEIPQGQRNKKVERRNIKLAVIGGLIGAIVVPICFTL